MSDSDAEYETYVAEQEQIEAMFPNAQFTISISLSDLDDQITDESTIVVKQSYGCYCYDANPRNTDWIVVKSTKITNRVVLNELIKQNLNLECNHRYVEGFHQLTDCQFEIMTGS